MSNETVPNKINTSSKRDTSYKEDLKTLLSVIISTWPKLKNNICFRTWEYTVLSQVQTIKGLFLFQKIDIEHLFKPTEELIQFIKRAEWAENTCRGNCYFLYRPLFWPLPRITHKIKPVTFCCGHIMSAYSNYHAQH
jgi:hypothetical protein